MPTTIKTGLPAIMAYFGMKTGEFRKEWDSMADADKAQIRSGIESFNTETQEVTGSLTY